MALIDKLTAIAEGFRSSRGTSGKLTLTQMAALAAEPLGIEEQMPNGDILDYIKVEVMEVVDKVRSVLTDESIVYLAMSDTHYPGDEDGAWNQAQNNEGSLHTAMAAKALAYTLPLDFVAHLGDVGNGEGSTTPDEMKAQIQKFVALFKEAKGTIPCFIAIGNHDPGIYYHNAQTDGGVHTLAGEWLYNNFTAYSDSENTVFGGVESGGYCYRDFPEKKLRVFLLNSAEQLITDQTDRGPLPSQQLWTANALKELGSKADAAEWSFLVLCHYPLDYGEARPISNVFKAYVKGESITINGTTVSFSGYNGAKFVVQHHGHTHCFKYARLNGYDSSGTMTEYDAWRVAIPNVQYSRENYYTDPYYGVYFCDDTSYPKTPDTANETSFVVNVINPSEQIIHSICYGAGYDRVIGYGATEYYSISKNFVNVTSNNTITSIEAGQPYSEIITVDSGCDITTLTVTMGPSNISADVITSVDGGYRIDIPEVTGNVVIVAKAQARPNFTNLVPLSVNSDGTDFNVDGDGYDNDTYINSSGSLGTLSGFTSTGFIPVSAGEKTIRIAGDGISVDSEYTRFAFYNSDFSLVVPPIAHYRIGSSQYYGSLINEDATAVTFDMTTTTNGYEGVYMRVCTKGNGENLIVTVNEEITYGETDSGDTTLTYGVIQNLTNVTSNNTTSNVTSGDSFQTTLIVDDGYELESVTVTMGGVDVTSSVYVNGNIHISNVTGNIVITASADIIQTSGYTNIIPLAVEVDGTTPYNSGKGYKTDTRLSTSSQGERVLAGMCVTGYIPIKHLDTIRIKNVTLESTADGSTGNTFLWMYNGLTEEAGAGNQTYSVLNGAMVDGVITLQINSAQIKYVRLCCGKIDDTSIVTINEEIV